MDAQLKVKWVEALRSGRYEQGTGYLNRDGRHCCLGVLCEVMGLEGVAAKNPTHPVSYNDRTQTLSGDSRLAAGLTDAQHQELTSMNDIRELSFAYIASYIEREL